jgi:hypothetical protein
MDGLVGTLLFLALIGFIADINSGAIVGSIFSARSGFRSGFAFLGGATGVRMLQGAFGMGIVYTVVDTFLGFFKLDQTTYILMSLAGLAIILAGLREVLGKGDNSEAEKLKDSENAGTISTKAALVTGIGVNIISLRQWIFTAVAVSTIGSARVGWPVGLALFAAYLALSSWLIVGLLILKAVRPNAAPDIMDHIAAWTDAHLASIVAWMAIVIGVFIMGYGLFKWLG